MSSDLLIRPVRPDDRPAILDLVRLSLGEGATPRTPEFWRWKHEEGPFGASPGLVAVADDTLVGVRMFLPWGWRLAAERLQAVRAVDTVTHPSWRGRRVFTTLTRALLEKVEKEGYRFVFNTPNRQSRPGYLKMGWESAGRVPLVLRPMRAGALPAALGMSTPAAGERPMDFDRIDLPSAADALDQPDLVELVERHMEGDRRLHTERTAPYPRWRYAAVPGIRYHSMWQVRDGSGALVILRTRRRRGGCEVGLMEVVLSGDRAGRTSLAAVLRAVASAARPDWMIASAARGTPERRALATCGFVPMPGVSPRFVFRRLGNVALPRDLRRGAAWRVSLGDVELF